MVMIYHIFNSTISNKDNLFNDTFSEFVNLDVDSSLEIEIRPRAKLSDSGDEC